MYLGERYEVKGVTLAFSLRTAKTALQVVSVVFIHERSKQKIKLRVKKNQEKYALHVLSPVSLKSASSSRPLCMTIFLIAATRASESNRAWVLPPRVTRRLTFLNTREESMAYASMHEYTSIRSRASMIAMSLLGVSPSETWSLVLLTPQCSCLRSDQTPRKDAAASRR